MGKNIANILKTNALYKYNQCVSGEDANVEVSLAEGHSCNFPWLMENGGQR